ncbi:MAG: hypothetical protein V1492_02710 [Candidatus Micrarchaeota archaeon]
MADIIRADDALISTDVDRLIKIISERKKLSFFDLQRLSGIKSKNDLETWVRVLEDEGYVKVQYGITGTYVIWAGGNYTAPQESHEEKAPEEPAFKDMPEEPAYSQSDVQEEREDLTPEELLEEYVRMKRSGTEPEKDDAVKDNIMKKLLEEEREEKHAEESEPEPAEMASESEEEPSYSVTHEDEAKEHELTPASLAEQDSFEPTARVPFREERVPARKSVYTSDVRDLIAAYMEEIREEKAKLESLKRKKEVFYREEMVSLEKKAEGELLSFMDTVLEHENKLLELREGVLQLPEKVDRAAEIQQELRVLSAEGKEGLRDTKKKVDDLSAEMKFAERELRAKIADLRLSVEDGEKKVDALENLKESIGSRSEKAAASVDAARVKIDELMEMLTTLEDYLKETKNTKAEVEVGVAALKIELEKKQADVVALETELDEVSKISAWAREYVNDYDGKIAEIESYVRKSDEDMVLLKEAAESRYIKKYLGELESLSDRYEDGLSHAVKTEKEIDGEMDQAKERITHLIKESHKLINKVGEEVEKSPDYDEIKKRAENRNARIRKTVEEKVAEKSGLSDAIRKKKKNGKK